MKWKENMLLKPYMILLQIESFMIDDRLIDDW